MNAVSTSSALDWRIASFFTMLLAIVFSMSGCVIEEDPRLAQQRARLLIDQPPENVSSIETAKSDISDRKMVTIQGQADLEAYASIHNGRALMLVRELIEDEHSSAAGHDPSSCPFCKRRLAAAPKAAVEFVGEDGSVLPYQVQQLFDLNQGDIVIVRGEAELDEKLDIMKITATGIYLPR